MEVCSIDKNIPNTVLLKLVGNQCNLSCVYCSERIKNIKYKPINVDDIFYLIDQIPCGTDIILHGGEPSLVGIDNMQRIVDYIIAHDPNRTPSIQTNGFLGVEWANFFEINKNKLRIGISIDGPQNENLLRVTKNGENSFEKTNQFIEFLEERNLNYKCIATINRYNSKNAIEFMDYFAKRSKMIHLQLNPCFDMDSDGELKQWAVSPADHLEFCRQCFILWIRFQLYKKFELRPMTDTIKSILNRTHVYFNCYKYISLYPGNYYRYCDVYDSSPEIALDGKIKYQENTIKNLFINEIRDCQSCSRYSRCNIGCPVIKAKFRKNEKVFNEYCQYKTGIYELVNEYLKGKNL